jgi:CRP/FNR family transcriptional regulator, cyclic AMP receptor protein
VAAPRHGSRSDGAVRSIAMATEHPADLLASLALFADLSPAQLEEVSHLFAEASFGPGERILRQGIRGSNFHVIADGEAKVVIDGADVARLARGDFFGEMSVLLDRPPIADVTAATPLRALVLAGSDLRDFLVGHPAVAYRMLVTLARRLYAAESSEQTDATDA